MVFPEDVSNVPLTEDILKKKLDFVKSWSEWAIDNRLFVIADGDTGATIFTVPKNQALYITSCWITGSINPPIGAEFARGGLQIRGGGVNGLRHMIRVHVGAITGQNQSNSLSFNMPVKLEEGQSVLISNDGDDAGRFSGGFVGFLVDKRIS